MTTELLRTILTGFIIIGAPVAFYFHFLQPNIRGWKNRRQPTITISATVMDKSENMDNLIFSSSTARFNGTVHCVTFRTADGLLVTLTVPRETYWIADPGITGILTYQGTKCECFDPDK